MEMLLEYDDISCPWHYFDNSYKVLLGGCLTVFGIFGVLLNGWLFATFIHSHLLTFRSHILVLNLCTSSLGRNILGFPFAGSSAIAKRWLFGTTCCQLFSFFNTFLGAFQMVSLLMICLERYFQAKYYKNEKELSFKLYCGLVGACWLSSAIIAAPPLMNYGVYSCDVTRTICSLSWPSATAGARYLGYNVPYILFGAVLPISLMIYFIIKAVQFERKYYRSEQQKEQGRLTKSLHAACITTLILWIPAAVLVCWQWVPLLLFGYQLHVPAVLALIAPIASEAATCTPVLCYLAGDERLRAALLGRMRRQYALLRPDRARRYIRT